MGLVFGAGLPWVAFFGYNNDMQKLGGIWLCMVLTHFTLDLRNGQMIKRAIELAGEENVATLSLIRKNVGLSYVLL